MGEQNQRFTPKPNANFTEILQEFYGPLAPGENSVEVPALYNPKLDESQAPTIDPKVPENWQDLVYKIAIKSAGVWDLLLYECILIISQPGLLKSRRILQPAEVYERIVKKTLKRRCGE